MSQTPPVSRADIEAKLAEIRGRAEGGVSAATDQGPKAALAGAGLVVVVLAFLLGRRRGKKRRTVVEVVRL